MTLLTCPGGPAGEKTGSTQKFAASKVLVGNVLLLEYVKTPLVTPLVFCSACSGGLSTVLTGDPIGGTM